MEPADADSRETFADWSDASPPAGCTWPAATLPRGEAGSANSVWIYCVGLEQPAGVVSRLAALLSPDERSRAERLLGDELRRRFRVSHGVLRVLLGAHTRTDPRALRFDTSGVVNGKPRLTEPPPGRAPTFNLSHSGELALVAVSQRVEVGVDVEQVLPLDDLWQVANTVYTPLELRALRGHPQDRQLDEWYGCWTRKEAALKAVGKGFGIDPRLVELLTPHFVPTTRSEEFSQAAGDASWKVTPLHPAPGYAAALAALGASSEARLERWPR